MKLKQLFFFVFICQLSFSQTQYPDKSHELELDGWKTYFTGNKEESKRLFTRAVVLDSTNVLAKMGLYFSKETSELTEKDFDMIGKLPYEGEYYDVMYSLILYKNMDQSLSDSLRSQIYKYDSDFIKFKAYLTDASFKVYDESEMLRETGEFKNRKPVGVWKRYGYQNKLYNSYTFSQETDTVVIDYYKPDGAVARREITTGMPATNKSIKYREYLFWQENPGQEPAYLWVSKEGFKIFDKNNPVVFDQSTPDNVIQRIWNVDKKKLEAVIWKNGKKQPYTLCEHDGSVITEMIDGVRKTYRWKDCKKELIED